MAPPRGQSQNRRKISVFLVKERFQGQQEEKRATEDAMVGYHHCLNGQELEQTPGDTEGQGSLACCSPWGHRVGHDLATEHMHEKECFLLKDKIPTLQSHQADILE